MARTIFKWARIGGYEVSSKGDPRFSALNAVMPDGRTIEQIYQLDPGGKAYEPGGTNWRLGKGKPAKDGKSREQLWEFYLGLWRSWAHANIPLMRELYFEAARAGWLLSDRYAKTEINQARALSIILNELIEEARYGKQE
jgi:hypothetical protein